MIYLLNTDELTLTKIVESGRKLSTLIVELQQRGFIESCGNMGVLLSQHPELRQFIARFSGCGTSGRSKGSCKYSSFDLFNKGRIIMRYDVDQKEKLVQYLVDMFLSVNPYPSHYLRGAYTSLLHNQNLYLTSEQQSRIRNASFSST